MGAKKIIQSLACFTVIQFTMVGCATNNNTTDPSKVGFFDSLAYKTVGNKGLEEELKRRERRSQELEKQLNESRARLLASKKKSEDLESRLRKIRFKTVPAREKARKLAAELKLKRQDLKNKERELVDLEKTITVMKAQKVENKKMLIRIQQAERDLLDTQQEIAVLTDYMEQNLFNEAENALLYD